MTNYRSIVDDAIRHNSVVLFSSDNADSERIRDFIKEIGGSIHEVRVDNLEHSEEISHHILQLTEGISAVPTLFVLREPIGGFQRVYRAYQTGQIRGFLGER